jgi:hypothetical protein
MISGSSSLICGDETSGEFEPLPAGSRPSPCADATPPVTGLHPGTKAAQENAQPINRMAAFIRNNRILRFTDAALRQKSLPRSGPFSVLMVDQSHQSSFLHFAGVCPRIKPDWPSNRKLSSKPHPNPNHQHVHQNPNSGFSMVFPWVSMEWIWDFMGRR